MEGTPLSADNWKNLGFAQLQQTLDEQSSRIYESQEEGLASRRALSSQTKAFRKLNDEEKLQEIRSLLKSYQSSIDALTNRTKFAEQCFMNVYKSLALLPDPAPLLESQQTEIENLKSQIGAASRPSDDDSRLARELERQTLRVSQLEKQLASPSASSATDPTASSQTNDLQWQARLDQLENELAQRKLQINDLQTQVKSESALAKRYQTEHQQLSGQLAKQRDYTELKQELALFKQKGASATSTSETVGHLDPIDTTDVVVNLRREIKSLTAKTHQLANERDSMKRDLNQLRSLSAKLEDDLTTLQSSDSFSTISGWTAVPRGGPGSIGQGSGSTSHGASAVSGIIMQQRDRYKKRMQELEAKLHKSESELGQSKQELQTMKQESYKLYDRIRQLQAHTASGTTPQLASLNAVPPLYEPTLEQRLKELDLDRRCLDQPKFQVKLLELSARALVDPKFRLGSAAYISMLHILVILGLVF